MIQEDLNTYVINKLNENTQGITFNGGFIFVIDNGAFVVKTQVGYTITETDYVPTFIPDWRATVNPFKNVDMQEYIQPISFAFKQEYLEEGLDALEEFRQALNGASDTIGDYTAVFKIGIVSAPSTPIQHSGSNWILVDIQFNASLSKGTLYGNNVTFKIAPHGDTLEEVVYTKIDLITSTDPTQSTDENGLVTIKNNRATHQMTVGFMYESDVTTYGDLFDWLWQSWTTGGVNDTFDIRVDYTATLYKTGEYVITNMTQHIEYGVLIGFDVTFYKYG